MISASLVIVNSTPSEPGHTVVGAATLAEIDDTYKPERAQHPVIELSTAVDVSDTHRHMIQHGCSLRSTPENLLEKSENSSNSCP